MQCVITSYGGGKILFHVFNAIAMTLSMGNGSGDLASNLFRLTGSIGLLWTLVQAYAQNSILVAFKWFVWFIFATSILLAPKVSIIIKDPISFGTNIQKVDNVPMAMGVFAGLISQIGQKLTEIMELNFTLSDYLPYSETGSVFASNLLSKRQQLKITDPIFNKNMEQFVQQCVIYDAMIGQKYSVSDLKNSADIWGLVSAKASPLLGFTYVEPNQSHSPKGQIITCKEGAVKLSAKWNDYEQEGMRKHGIRSFPGNQTDQAKSQFEKYLPMSYRLIAGISSDAPKLLQQEMMINTLEKASLSKLNAGNVAIRYGKARAISQQNNNFVLAGELAKDALPAMKNVFEALCYGAFIFIFILMSLPNGYRAFFNYLGILVWIQMWAPMYAILNLIMSVTAMYQTQANMTDRSLTFVTSQAISTINTDMNALAGMLSFSIPPIAYMIVRGGAASFVHLANHLGSLAQSAISSAGQELATGNISLSNFSQGNQSLNNLSAFKTNRNIEHFSGQNTSNLGDGTLRTTNPENIIFRGGSGLSKSSLATEFSLNGNLQEQCLKSSSEQSSLGENKSLETREQIANLSREMIDANSNRHIGEQNQSGKSMDSSFSQNKSLQKIDIFAKQLQTDFKISENRALQYALAASITGQAGIGQQDYMDQPTMIGKKMLFTKISNAIGNLGLSLNGSAGTQVQKDHSDHLSIDQIFNAAKTHQFNTSFEEVKRANDFNNHSNIQGENNSFMESFSSSIEKIHNASAQTQQHFNQAYNYLVGASSIKSKSLNENFNLTQEALENIATKPISANSGPMGLENARKILESGAGPLYQLKQDFLRDFQANKLEAISKASHFSSEGMAEAYQNSLFVHNNQTQQPLMDLKPLGKAFASGAITPSENNTANEFNQFKQDVREKHIDKNNIGNAYEKMQNTLKEKTNQFGPRNLIKDKSLIQPEE